MDIKFRAELWEWQGQGAWCFVSLPANYYGEIKLVGGSLKKGFGSVRVEVKIGGSEWRTSIFPDTKSGKYLLPVKKGIRKIENLNVGDMLSVRMRLVDF